MVKVGKIKFIIIEGYVELTALSNLIQNQEQC